MENMHNADTVSGIVEHVVEQPIHRNGAQAMEFHVLFRGEAARRLVLKSFSVESDPIVGEHLTLRHMGHDLYVMVKRNDKPTKRIAVWGEIDKITPNKEDNPTIWALNLKDKKFAIAVMRAYMVGFNPQVGGYAVKYADMSLGYLTKEEFEKLKQEGGHGI
jgi:hypothetical protein